MNSRRFLRKWNRSKGNTAQRLCDRCVVKFFVRWNKKRSEYLMYSRAFLWNMRVCFVSDVCRLRRQIFWEMKGKTEKILCGFSSIFPKYLGKYARKMRAGRYETGSEGKFASRWRAKSPDALCAVLPKSCPMPFYPLACQHRIKQRQHCGCCRKRKRKHSWNLWLIYRTE